AGFFCQQATTHRRQNELGRQTCTDGDDRCHDEYAVPATTCCQQGCQWHQQCSRTFGGVQRARVTGSIFRTENIAASCRENRIDLTPEQEDQGSKYHEGIHVVAPEHQTQQCQTFADKDDAHGVFTTDLVGDKPAQRTGNTIGDIVNRQGHRQQWQGHTEQGDRQRSQTVVSCNRTQLCSRHETTRSHQHEQDIQHPEHRHFQHLLGGVIDLVCHTCLGNCCFWCSWFNQQHGQHENCYALNDAEGQQGFFVTR